MCHHIRRQKTSIMPLFQWVIFFCRVQRFFLYEKNNLIKIDLELPDSLNFEDPDKLKEELDKLKEELDKLNEEFDKRNEGRYNFLEIMEKTHDLISQAEKDVLIVDDQSYEITLKAVQELAKVFMYQNFKKNLDNITERALDLLRKYSKCKIMTKWDMKN